MVGFNTIFNNNPFVGNRTKVSNNPKTETNFNTDPDEAIIIGEVIWKSNTNTNTKTFTAQNNPERRHSESEGFFTQANNRNNLDFSTSFYSTVAQASVSNGSFMPDRLSRNDSRGPFSSFGNKELAQVVGREFAYSA